MVELESAKDKVMMGAERRSMVMTEDEKKLTAYHEAGHAILALHCPDSDPIHKATIIPRGRALGMVMRLPESDRYSMSRAKLHADLCVAMGGRIAEGLIFGEDKVTTGASSDIKMVTSISRRMITEWGMSDKLGFLAYADGDNEVYLGHKMGRSSSVSGATQKLVDEEIKSLVDGIYAKAEKILKDNIDQLHGLAKALLEYETLSGDEIHAILRGEKLDKDRLLHSERATSTKKSSIPTSNPPASAPTIQPGE
jgi:cell division protease FtsH